MLDCQSHPYRLAVICGYLPFQADFCMELLMSKAHPQIAVFTPDVYRRPGRLIDIQVTSRDWKLTPTHLLNDAIRPTDNIQEKTFNNARPIWIT